MKSKNLKFFLISIFTFTLVVEFILYISFRVAGVNSYAQEYKKYILSDNLEESLNANAHNYDFEKPHPYFGYVLTEKSKKSFGAKRINNYGFNNEEDFPIKKNSNDFVIGIFGGSVAHFFASFVKNDPYFANKLKEINPKLKNKNIIFLNMALGASKQPQQFIIYSYFSEMFDFVINLDGENEINLLPPGNFPVEFPYYAKILFNDNQKAKSLLGENLYLKRKLSEKSINSSNFLGGISSLKYAFWVLEKNSLVNRMRNNEQLMTNVMVKESSFYNEEWTPEFHLDEAFRSWKKFSKKQAGLLKSNKTPYIFFVQPTMYLEGSKPLSSKEKELIFKGKARKHKVNFYTRLEKEAKQLKKEGVNYHLLTRAYSSTTKTVFNDGCCHVNYLGNKILAGKMAELIKKENLL